MSTTKKARLANAEVIEQRVVNETDLTVDIIASTPGVDSHGTMIDQNGWKLERFKKNPVITHAHDDRGWTGSDGLPIANAIPETIRVEDGKLKMKVRFTPKDVNEFGYKVWRLVKEGFLHGVSVGFMPMERPETVERDDGGIDVVFREMELLEVAFVTVPSNPETLVQRCIELEKNPDEIKRQVEEINDMENNTLNSKYRSYFEKKQPANAAATKVLKRFFTARGMDIPEDEVEAWKKMNDVLDEEAEAEPKPEVKPEEEPKPEEVKKEEEEITPAPTPTEQPKEAPSEEQKASVLLTANDLFTVMAKAAKRVEDDCVEALRNGEPVSSLDKVATKSVESLKKSIRSLAHTS